MAPYRPTRETVKFCKQLESVFPDSNFIKRKTFVLRKVCKAAHEAGYTDLIDIHCRKGQKLPGSMIYTHLPSGPAVHFRLSGITMMENITDGWNACPNANPELLLTNFKTAEGRRMARLFTILFPHNPDFQIRQLCVFHNQRDFMFFRRYKYAFRKEGEKVILKEIGPKFSLKVRRVLKGLPDPRSTDIEYNFNPHVSSKMKTLFAM
jgi:ribosome production factor 1